RKTAQAAPAVADFRANGWYWNPAESGTGFMFEAQGTRGFVAFFMYEEGTGKPLWYASEGGAGSFVAREDGSFEYSGELRYYTNGQPAWSGAYVSPSSTLVGPVTMRFVGNDVTVAFPGGRTQRATRFDFNGLGGVPKANQPETGWYWNPAEGGRGWAVEVQNDRVFMAMFHYNPDGTPTWNVLEGDMAGGTVRDTFALYGGGQTLTSTYRPGYSGTRYEAGTYAMSFRNP
ncbi:hypothetical protein, partial [Piscinibacter sakaiensis]|uniref:hypothetical protein n=1 Tax=Piscinibacter sakaiensis TaxID=1547922 RepID=UPI0018D1EAFF